MFNDWLHLLYNLYVAYFRPLIKWFLHRFTRLCELQRLCYGCESGAERVRKVERSLELSRRPSIKSLIVLLNQLVEGGVEDDHFRTEVTNRAVATVLQEKRINPKIHLTFSRSFGVCVDHIWAYRRLCHLVEALRTTPYDSDDKEHESRLLELWTLLMRDVPLEARVTKQWQEIGFQGDDPKTDFRGMGLLGLENLLFFARTYPGTSRHVLSHSHHPRHGYTFAVVGINITSMAWRLLRSGRAKAHFYNTGNEPSRLDDFHQLYCYLFAEFDRAWVAARPRSIMDFSIIQERFERDIVRALRSDRCLFKMNLSVENV